MEKLLSQGAPTAMFKINDLQTKVTITKDQLRKEQLELQNVEQLLMQVKEQEEVLKEKEQKLWEIGDKYNINFDVAEDEKKHHEAMALKEQKFTYDRHLQIAENATKAMKKKLKMVSKSNRLKLKNLQEERKLLEEELE